ncbi:MAG: thioredoxin domain-containing protein [Rubritalea sp.]|uniref:thioredoxin family protein n=1 Tax=Rubritalea sp. TaxID=2109375 RepID=UPI003242862E
MVSIKNIFLSALVTLVVTATSLFAGEGWVADIDEAKKLSKKENKPLFVEFTGSDWCPPCIMMEKEVFSKEAFKSGAQKDFILVKIDIPNGDKKLKKKNQKVLQKYNVSGVPTILLLDSEGVEFSRFTASQFNSVEKMLSELKRQLRIKNMF